eukprot:3852380-Pleurochrysis_carterae.AAC.3
MGGVDEPGGGGVEMSWSPGRTHALQVGVEAARPKGADECVRGKGEAVTARCAHIGIPLPGRATRSRSTPSGSRHQPQDRGKASTPRAGQRASRRAQRLES